MKKRLFSTLLTVVMLIGLLPTAVFAADNVAMLNGAGYSTIQAAVNAANDGDEITIISDIAFTTEHYVQNSDGYATLVNVVDKAITIDLNGKHITVQASAADLLSAKSTMLMSVFSADTNGKLTLKDSVGTGSVSVTANDATVYSLVCAYAGLVNIESGNYSVDKMGEGRGMIYSNVSDHSGSDGSNMTQGINVSGGTFTLGNIGTLKNGSPWIFNVSGTGTEWTMVTGGTYNANIQRQFWANEAMIPVTHYIEKNADNTWTVKNGATLYAVEGALTGPYYIKDWKIGYPSLEAFIAAANAGDPITIDMNDPLTLLKDITVTTPTDISEMILNKNDKIITLAENGTLTVSEDAEIVPVAALGYNLVTTKNEDGTTTYSVERITYTVTYTDGVENEVIFDDQISLVKYDDATPLFNGTPTRDGYTFIGWTPAVSETVTEDATYTAVWQENSVLPEPDPAPGFDYDAWYWALMMLYNQQFDVSASATEGGTITPAGISKVKYDKNITYTITPDEGYAISDVLVNGESVGAVSEYTIKRIKKDQTIHAIFVKTAWENPYTDVSSEAWYYKAVEFVSENGLMIGTGDNKFSPSAIVNRAMLVTVLWRLEGSPVVDSPVDFYDVPADEWYTAAVNWAAANGIINGYGDGIFGAMNDLTHEQIMAILNRYAVYKNWSENVSGNADDSYTNSEWAENNVLWADLHGMFDGIGSDISDLTEGADRAELAAYLRRFCERFMAE